MSKHIPVIPPLTRREILYSLFFQPLYWMQKAHVTTDDIAYYQFGDYRWFIVINPQLIEEVLVTQQKHFYKDDFLKHHANGVFGNGLLANDGAAWLQQRRLIQPAFHRQRINEYATQMVTKTAQHLRHITPKRWVNLHTWSMQLTLDIVAESLFGTISASDRQAISQALDVVMDYFASESDAERFWQWVTRAPVKDESAYQQAIATLDRVIDTYIDLRRTTPDQQHDLITMLLASQDEDGNHLSNEQIRDECKTMLLAGHETTALAVTWSMWLIGRHPQVMQKLRHEIATVLGTRPPTMADIPALTYTNQVIRESMRLYPPAFIISRTSIADIWLGEYHIPAGTTVNMSQYAVHRDARWYPNPDAFVPERWDDPRYAAYPKFTYFPFGGGPRLCIGQQFALVESAIMLVMMLQYGTWRLAPWQYITLQPSITIRPRFGMYMAVHPFTT